MRRWARLRRRPYQPRSRRNDVIPRNTPLAKRLKGRPTEERNRRIHDAHIDLAFLHCLHLEVNSRVTGETRAWLLTSVLVGREWLQGRSSDSGAGHKRDGTESWQTTAQRFTHELYVYDRTARVVADAYFNGQQVLFPDSARTLQDLMGRIETLIEIGNHDIKAGKGTRRAKSGVIDLEKVKASAQQDAKAMIDEIVVMAKAEALVICGENKGSALLVKNHLAAGLGGAH